MPFVVYHDDPRILANQAAMVGQYRAGQDYQQQLNYERARQDRREMFNANLANEAANRMNQTAQHYYDQRARENDVRARLDQADTLARLTDQRQRDIAAGRSLDSQAGLEFRGRESQANRDQRQQFHEDSQQQHADDAQRSWNQLYTRLGASSENQRQITQREAERTARAQQYHDLIQQNRADDRAYEAMRAFHQQDIQDARFKVEQASAKDPAGELVDPAAHATAMENYQHAMDAAKAFLATPRQQQGGQYDVTDLNPLMDSMQPQTEPQGNTQPAPRSSAEWMALPPGTTYIAPDGTKRVKR